jgi:hypothetical protein
MAKESKQVEVKLILNLGTKDKQRFGLKEEPALDGDLVSVTEEAANLLKSEGKACEPGDPVLDPEVRQTERRKTAAGARVMDKTSPLPTRGEDEERQIVRETKKK